MRLAAGVFPGRDAIPPILGGRCRRPTATEKLEADLDEAFTCLVADK